MLRYTRAYPPEALQAFPPASEWVGTQEPEGTVFLWDDLSLTTDPFVDEPAYRDESEEWQRFCREQLGFAVPADVG
jgi:hypothetical protein